MGANSSAKNTRNRPKIDYSRAINDIPHPESPGNEIGLISNEETKMYNIMIHWSK